MGTIRVACKLPAGLTVDHKPKDAPAAIKFTLNGANHPGAVAGFGMTDVDADLFKSWLENEGKDFAPVKTGAIFAAEAGKAGDKAKERKGDNSVQTGAEPIDPTKPARGIEPTAEMAAELDKLPDEPGGQTVATA